MPSLFTVTSVLLCSIAGSACYGRRELFSTRSFSLLIDALSCFLITQEIQLVDGPQKFLYLHFLFPQEALDPITAYADVDDSRLRRERGVAMRVYGRSLSANTTGQFGKQFRAN
ncbi:hypothetical protein F5B18DRAFT_298269 [Nemania serpens]|nr:hypothetical protein F5B18DRAFT_298269 [Nemania serpens]